MNILTNTANPKIGNLCKGEASHLPIGQEFIERKPAGVGYR
jgi:hypothetical protein